MALLPEVELTTDEQKVSYGFGLQFGEQLRRNGFDGLELEAVMAGVQHWFNHQQAALTDAEINPSYQVIQARQQAKATELDSKRQALAEQFLKANAERDEVTTTESGLQYKVIESGDGKQPKATDTVTTHYRGTLIDGREFDSSYQRNQPMEFPLNAVVRGWTEGLQLVSEGGKIELSIPSDLGYGQQGAPPVIPPDAQLHFIVELHEVY